MNSILTVSSRRTAAALLAIAGLACGAASAVAQQRAVSSQAYPTGDPSTSVVMLERSIPQGIRVGESFDYTLTIRNLTSAPVSGLQVTEQAGERFATEAANPQPNSGNGNTMVWEIATLGPREAKTMRIRGRATAAGAFDACATVVFTTKMCSGVDIVEPALELVKTAPNRVIVCDPILLQYVVSNPGSGVARNVTITDQLPNGWTTQGGQREVRIPVGDLNAGQSRQFSVQAQASDLGSYSSEATAQEAGGLTASAGAATEIVKPSLSLTMSGPGDRYLQRPGDFQLTLRNDGDAEARDTVLTATVPQGTSFMQAAEGSQFAGGNVTWNFGTLGVGESRTVSYTVRAEQRGNLRATAQARAYCADATADAPLTVRGIPAILLEVIDVHDPIEIGASETYEIKVFNQGSADDTNILVTAIVPEEQEFVSADGPTGYNVNGKTITFDPLPALAPKRSASYQIIVRGVQAADVRFKVTLNSDELTRDVEETESTHVY